jgi:SAM-dependent methyltransferase
MASQTLIRPEDMMRLHTLQQLIDTADRYYSASGDIESFLQKPFSSLDEAPEITLTFLHVVRGLNLPRGSLILDFGAGTCWTSRLLAGFGFRVIALDVSATALEIGRELMRRRPLLPGQFAPEFLLFDGERIELPDGSVDGISCISAFHHVPNPDAILAEFARILRPGGVAGFSEPGPNHSRTPQSQHEMRNFDVLENNVDIDAIWAEAQRLGFCQLELGLFYPEPVLMPLARFKGFLDGQPSVAFEASMRALMRDRRLFFMEKGPHTYSTSAESTGLGGSVETATRGLLAAAGERVVTAVGVANNGDALWRPSTWPLGGVKVGGAIGQTADNMVDFNRWMIPTSRPGGLYPQETAVVEVDFTAPDTPGRYHVQLQLVAEYVAWFGDPVTLTLDVS